MATSSIAEIKAGLAELQEFESKLEEAGWEDVPSPTGVDDSVLKRYIAARDLYLERRLQSKVVEHILTFDPNDETFNMPNGNDGDEVDEKHSNALTNLETTMKMIQAQVSQLRDNHQANKSRREELERMLQDMEDGDSDMQDDDDDEDMEEEVDDEDLEKEQERIEELQRVKRQLEEELTSIQKQTAEVQERTRRKHDEIAMLEQQVDCDEDMNKKIEELREMKTFYDSMRGVVEELGGVKIEKVTENPTNRHLQLLLCLYDEYKVEIELEEARYKSRRFLKLVDAKWASEPKIGDESFALPLETLDDLVKVAKSHLGPPQDLRFIVRESLALVRITRDLHKDLSTLRQNVLTKVEAKGKKIVCSLNDGLVIVMQLYEDRVRVEQIVGVGGWDTETIKKIQDSLTVDENSTPSSVVSQVQKQIEDLQESGFAKPGTPKMVKKNDDE